MDFLTLVNTFGLPKLYMLQSGRQVSSEPIMAVKLMFLCFFQLAKHSVSLTIFQLKFHRREVDLESPALLKYVHSEIADIRPNAAVHKDAGIS